MSRKVADVVVERLIDWGVDTIFGLPAMASMECFEALRTHQDKLRFIQVRMKKLLPLRPVGTPNTPAGWESASQPQDRAVSTCSMVFTTPNAMASRCSRSQVIRSTT